MSIPFLLDEKPHYCTGRLGRRAVGKRAKGSLRRRSSKFEERRRRLCAGKRFSAPQIVWNSRIKSPDPLFSFSS